MRRKSYPPSSANTTRTCVKCGKSKPPEAFPKDRPGYVCKACLNARRQTLRHTNGYREYMHQWYKNRTRQNPDWAFSRTLQDIKRYDRLLTQSRGFVPLELVAVASRDLRPDEALMLKEEAALAHYAEAA